jgi:uncharacterized protein (DUF885 family)
MPEWCSLVSNSDKQLEVLAKNYFDTFVERNPTFATVLGIHDYDDKLDDLSPEDVEKTKTILRDTLTKLEKIDSSKHSDIGLIDREIFKSSLETTLFQIEEIANYKRNPDFGGFVGSALFFLFSRTFAPVDERMRCIAARLEQVPRAFEEFKRTITEPVKLWTELALQSIQGIPGLVQYVVAIAADQITQKDHDRLTQAADIALKTLEEAKVWLEGLLPTATDDWAIGPEKLAKFLKLRGVHQTPDEILQLGEGYLTQFKEELKNLAEAISPGTPIKDVRENIKDDHPKDFDAVLKEYKEWVKKAREWVIENDFATVLEGELKVIETPDFLRPIIPFAGLAMPSVFDEKKSGEYIVTRPDDEKNLREHYRASIPNVSIHEAFPGHFLQGLGVGKAPIARILIQEVTLVEGWAFYCEQTTIDMGFNDTPEARFAQTLDLIWRAARIIIDVKLSSGKMSFDDGMKMLMEETGMEEPSARAEVSRYTQSPGYPLSYLLGRHLIMNVRKELEDEFGDDFSLKLFHDTIISAGSIPVSFIPKLYRAAAK